MKFKYVLQGWKFQTKAFFNRQVYRWNGGYHCHSCNTLIPIWYDHIESEVGGKRMILSNYSKHLYCAHCLGKKIQTYFRASDQLSPLPVQQCDWLGRDEKVIGIIWGGRFDPIAKELDLDVRFGGQWWNGHHASLKAFEIALFDGNPGYRTSVFVYGDSKHRMRMRDKNGVTLYADW